MRNCVSVQVHKPEPPQTAGVRNYLSWAQALLSTSVGHNEKMLSRA